MPVNIIKTEPFKIPHVKQPCGGENMTVMAPMLPRVLATNPFSKHWDQTHVVAEITSDRELIFWVRGRRFESKFLGEQVMYLALRGYPGHNQIGLHAYFVDGKMKGVAVVPNDSFANQQADFGKFIKAWENLQR